MSEFFHSVTLDKELCKGCTNCVKRCPTEAIRVRDGKAYIIKERCIDCGECIRICPHHAKQAVVDPLSIIEQFDYTIALPAPSLYGQFSGLNDVDALLGAIKKIGFDEVFEVAAAAEAVSQATRRILAAQNLPRPLISSACPAVLRIVRVRFPSLIPHVIDLRSPMELAARWSKQAAAKRTGLAPERIGAIFITPCPAKVTSVKMPLGTTQSCVDGAVAVRDVYPKLLPYIKQILEPEEELEEIALAGATGIGWGTSGGEAEALRSDRYLAADGIENVIKVLEGIEDDRISDVDFVELNACTGGCVGGVLQVENPYIARVRMRRLAAGRRGRRAPLEDMPSGELHWDHPLRYEPVMRLDGNISVAMGMLEQIKQIEKSFNGMDCGACGAPSCRALAEDIVRGLANEDMCIYRMREKLQAIVERNKEESKP
jgi:Fe-S-cluster-containing hydrogenase component 2